MAWVWCEAISGWVAPLGPVPGGYTYPADLSNDPDLSSLFDADSGQLDIVSGDAAFDVCGATGTVEFVYYSKGPDPAPLWHHYGVSIGLSAPTDTHLYVVVYGPNWNDTDPSPTWDPSLALTGPPPVPAAGGIDSVWKAVAVDVGTGANPVELLDAEISPISWGLNEPGGGDITMPTTQLLAAELLDPNREIQIWRDDQILFWGPVVTEEAGRDEIKVEYAGARWYFTRRFFGKADRTNLLANGDFEDGADEWTAVGLTPVVDPFRSASGHKSIRLTGTAQDHDTYISQTFTHGEGGHPLGDLVTLAVHVWVGSSDYAGTALEARGVWASVNDDDDNAQIVTIDDDTPRDRWVRLDELEFLNVFAGDTIEVRLYPPAGTAWYDLAVLVYMESLSFIEQDLATIISGIVAYAQDRYPGFSHGKSDLGIDTNCPPTGITLSRTWQFADHENIDGELAVFTAGRNGVDLSIEVTATTRTLTLHYPQQGTLHDDIPLVYDDNMLRFTLARDRNQKADTALVLGPGDGPDREEGGATTTPNGPTLEDVTTAPDGTPIGQLDHLAAERVAVISHPEILEVVCTDLIGVAGVGDWFPVTIDCDAVQVGPDEIYRVVRMVANPADDTVAMTLNLREPVTPEEAMARFPRAVDACLAPGGGVWVVGSDGGVGSFGAATFHGSIPDDEVILNAPVVAIVPHGAGGYWLVAADAGCFNYGDAPARAGITVMVETEYPRGDRAIVAAEPYDPDGDDTLIMIADDGATYIP